MTVEAENQQRIRSQAPFGMGIGRILTIILMAHNCLSEVAILMAHNRLSEVAILMALAMKSQP